MAGALFLLGIDLEDTSISFHGSEEQWAEVFNAFLAEADPDRTGILVLGAGKDPGDDPTGFWGLMEPLITPGHAVTMVNEAAILSQSFLNFAMIVITTSRRFTPDGGLSSSEVGYVNARRADLRAFILSGGVVVRLTQEYVGPSTDTALEDFGPFERIVLIAGDAYEDVTVTVRGLDYAFDSDSFDFSHWHEVWASYPSNFEVLVENNNQFHTTYQGYAAVIGAVNLATGLPPPSARRRRHVYGTVIG